MADRTRSFSVYLLEKTFNEKNCLTKDHALSDTFKANGLPEGSTLFVLDSKVRTPWWVDYFRVHGKLEQTSKGAIVIVPAGGRHFAICFGHVQHNLRDDSYVYDFGIRVTLNSVDRDKLKSTDTLEPGASRRKRTQLPNESDLTLFDFDQDGAILRSLTGRVRSDLAELFKYPTGTSNLRLSTKRASGKLPELLSKLLELYESDLFTQTFPHIRNIEPVRDPAVVSQLDQVLLDAIKSKSGDVTITIPEIINHDEITLFAFSGAGKCRLYRDIYIGRYYEYLSAALGDLGSLQLDDTKKHKLIGFGENEDPKRSYNVYRCFVFDASIQEDSAIYHLSEGVWYRFDTSLASRLKAYLDPHFEDNNCLPSFNNDREDEYNEAVAGAGLGYANLDKQNIAPHGQKPVEPCDLIRVNEDIVEFTHVKISTQSKELSHLFNQGINSVECLRDDAESVVKLRTLLESRMESDAVDKAMEGVVSGKILVRFAIVTHKKQDLKSDNLPLFSRLSLMRTLKALRRMSVDRSIVFVADTSPPDQGRSKKRKSKSEGAEAAIGDDGVEEEAEVVES